MHKRKSIRQLLIDIAEAPAASQLSRVIAYYYPNLNLKSKSALFETMFKYYKSDLNKVLPLVDVKRSEDEIISKTTVKAGDYRIKSVTASSLRGIPDADINGTSFGLNFESNNQINSALILARNGTGKSSIFSALEMVYAQEISEKRLRSSTSELTSNDFKLYLQRYGSTLKPQCEVATPSGEFSIENPIFNNPEERKIVGPRNHFISDFDIYNYGKRDFDGDSNSKNSFHYLIANSLGLGEFLVVRNIFQDVANYNRTTEKTRLSEKEADSIAIGLEITKSRDFLTQKQEEVKVLKNETAIESKSIQINQTLPTKVCKCWITTK